MLDKILYQNRHLAVILSFLFCSYVAFAFWFVIPFGDFATYWQRNAQLVVWEIPETSLAAPHLKPGDIILAIDGNTVHRSAHIYTTLSKTSYEYTIQREDEMLIFHVPFSGGPTLMGMPLRLPTTVLAFVFLLTSIIVVRLAKKDNPAAVRVAYIFLITAVSLMGMQGELLSVSGAWVARTLWFPTSAGILYLGFVPHIRPLSPRITRFFKWAFATAGFLAVISFLEGVILFPQYSSFDQIVGYSPYALSLFSSGVAWIIVLTILIIRSLYTPVPTYERQQIHILLYFLALAIIPASFLTLIPSALMRAAILPFPTAIALFVLVPAGFLFVILRQGYLGLDIVFSKTIIFLTTALILLTIYGIGFYTIIHHLDSGTDLVLPATLLLFPILILARYVNQPVDSWITGLFYGPVTTNQLLPEFVTSLRNEPEMATIEAIVQRVAATFEVSQLLLVLNNEDGLLQPWAKINVPHWQPEQLSKLSPFNEPLLHSNRRSKAGHPLFQTYPWIELALPIMVRQEQIGFMALSRPAEGYFNAEQVLFLARVADIIAVGSETISLFAASQQLSLRLLAAQEVERKNLAAQIHDRPLQIIAFAHHTLRNVLANPHNCQPEAAAILHKQNQCLQEAIAELRQVCTGLYPPAIDQGLDLVVTEVAHYFEEKFNLEITQEITLPPTIFSSPDVATAVYRITTEALNNVVKHSQTCRAKITLTAPESHLQLTVADEGVGCSIPSLSITELTRRQHLGLRGMFEWAALVDGKLSIESNQPQGTKVILEIPN